GRKREKKEKENKIVAVADPIPGLKQEKRELLPVIMMDAWNEVLSPAERYRLRSFLPEGHKQNETAVMSLLKEETSRFWVVIAAELCRSVCEGKQTPDAVLKKERELKIFQSRYFKDLKMYHGNFISEAEGLKRLCVDTCPCDDRMFCKELQRTSHDLTVLKI
ncbi:hypothetical protein KI387_033518, partial [Taxus chinensis]